jgi:hypothetical protein
VIVTRNDEVRFMNGVGNFYRITIESIGMC